MPAYKKRTALLVGVLILSAAALAVSRQLTRTEPGRSQSYKSNSMFSRDPNYSPKTDKSPANHELVLKSMLAVLIVITLGAAAVYVAKKYGSRITGLAGKKIQVVETVGLGPRKSLHMVKISNQYLLIGSTNENITKLADVTDAVAEINSRESENSVSALSINADKNRGRI